MGGKPPALVPPEPVGLFAVKLLKHLNTPLYVRDTVFSGKRNYF
jgi:predicted SPOUT superfamily RNA methylase MTH1